MLGKYITIDNLQYPNSVTTNIAYENNEKVNKSESGKDLVSSVRLLKHVITFTFQVSSYWRDLILTDCSKLSVTLKFGSKTLYGRLRVTADVLAPYSEECDNTDGYWTMTVVFTER